MSSAEVHEPKSRTKKVLEPLFVEEIKHLPKRKQIEARNRKIYDLLVTEPMNSFRLQKLTGLKATEIRHSVHFLIAEGVVEAKGHKRARVYSVVMV